MPFLVQRSGEPSDKREDEARRGAFIGRRDVGPQVRQEAVSRERSRMTKPIRTAPRRKCLILGAGGHGRVVLDILMSMGRFDVVGFVDSNPDLKGRRIDGLEVLGSLHDVPLIQNERRVDCAIVAIGDNGVRRHFADRLEQYGIELINAIHPSARLAHNVSLGRNLVIAAGSVVCAHCQIGDSVILNTGCIVDHESLIGTATHICPGARLAGRVAVESGAFVGIGATIIQNLRIGYEAVVGAGAVVIRDVAPMSTVVGVPAREIKLECSNEDLKDWLMPEFLRTAQLAQPSQAKTR
jgi:sugar O-acyltransferase (sialic acid O-acetyltransferase NeuD family)